MKHTIRLMTIVLFAVGALLSGCGSSGSGGNGLFSSADQDKTAKVTITAAFPANSGTAQKSVIPDGTTTIDIYYRTMKNLGQKEQFEILPDGTKQPIGIYNNYTTIDTANTATTKISLTSANPSQTISLQPAEGALFVALAFDKDGILLGATSASGQLLAGNNDVRLTFLNGDWRFSTQNSFGNYTSAPVTLSDGTTFNGLQMGLNYNQIANYLPVGTVPSAATLQQAIGSFLKSFYSVDSTNSASFAVNPVVNGKPQSPISLSSLGNGQYYYNYYYGNDLGYANYQWAFSGAKTASSFSFNSNLNSSCSNGNGYYDSYGYGSSAFRGASAISYKFSSYSTCATSKVGDKRVSMSGNNDSLYSIFQKLWTQPTQTFSNYTSNPKNYVTSGSVFENYLLTSNLSPGTGSTVDMTQVYPVQNSAVLDGATITGNLFEFVVTKPYSYEIVKTSVAKAAKLADLAAIKSSSLDKAHKAAQSSTNLSLTNIVYTDYAPVVIVTRKTDGTIDYGDWYISGQISYSTYDQATGTYKYTYTRPAPLKDAKSGIEFYPQNMAWLNSKQTYDQTTGKYSYVLPNKGGLDTGITLPVGKTNIGDWCDGSSGYVKIYDPKTRLYSIDRTKCGNPEFGANGVVEPYEFITLVNNPAGSSTGYYSGSVADKQTAKTVKSETSATTTTPKINYGDFVVSAYLKTSETYNAYSYPVTLKGKPLPKPTYGKVVKGPVSGAYVSFTGTSAQIRTDANGKFLIAAPGVAMTSDGGIFYDLVTKTIRSAPRMSAEAGATVITPITTVLSQLSGAAKTDFLAALAKLGVTTPLTNALDVVTASNKIAITLNEILGSAMASGTTNANKLLFGAALTASINAATPASEAALATAAISAATDLQISTSSFSAIASAVAALKAGDALPSGSTTQLN